MEDLSTCSCTGMRYCSSCMPSERVQNIIKGNVILRKVEDIITNQSTELRLSSCSFLQLKEESLALCTDCGNVFQISHLISCCDDHNTLSPESVKVEGFFFLRDGISAEDEDSLLHKLDTVYPWKDSQSGRRKQEYGPKKNFKKKKLNLSDVNGIPAPLKPLIAAVESFALEKTGESFEIAEANILDYSPERFSSFDPHVDDTWIWGRRIVGANLLTDCPFTFVSSEGLCVTALLPRRSFFIMSGKSRYEWMHGIRPGSFKGRRISITFRELSDEVKNTYPDICESIVRNAQLFF